MSNLEAVKFYIDNKKNINTNTLKQYLRYINGLLCFCYKPLTEITSEDIESWTIHLYDSKLKPQTVFNGYISLQSFFTFLIEEDVMLSNPLDGVRWPKQANGMPKPMSPKTSMKIFEAAKENIRDRALLTVLLHTGVRENELVNILITDIDWENKELFIRKGKYDKQRVIPISTESLLRIREYLDGRNDTIPFLFASRKKRQMTGRCVLYIVEKYCKLAGVSTEITPHTFRHSYATMLAEQKTPPDTIAYYLGHSNYDYVKWYAKLATAAIKQQFDEFY
jgi:integrase/recombinase XerC